MELQPVEHQFRAFAVANGRKNVAPFQDAGFRRRGGQPCALSGNGELELGTGGQVVGQTGSAVHRKRGMRHGLPGCDHVIRRDDVGKEQGDPSVPVAHLLHHVEKRPLSHAVAGQPSLDQVRHDLSSAFPLDHSALRSAPPGGPSRTSARYVLLHFSV
jgi:hypothetical protein